MQRREIRRTTRQGFPVGFPPRRQRPDRIYLELLHNLFHDGRRKVDELVFRDAVPDKELLDDILNTDASAIHPHFLKGWRKDSDREGVLIRAEGGPSST